MWNEEELLKQIDNYFDNITLEKFFIDLKEADCINLVEDITSNEET